MRTHENIAGNIYGRLTAIEIYPAPRSKRAVWKCRCECGNITYVSISDLKCGKTRSCGCLRIEFLKTGIAQRARHSKLREGQSLIAK